MNDKIFIPFSQATKEVFKMMLDLDVDTNTPQLLQGIVDEDDKINIVIGVTGDLVGNILYRFPKETTLEMVKIMSGMEFDEIDDFVTSALGEIANIISGNAVTGFSNQEIVCDILPPNILVGEELSQLEMSNSILRTQISTDIGEIDLDFMLKD